MHTHHVFRCILYMKRLPHECVCVHLEWPGSDRRMCGRFFMPGLNSPWSRALRLEGVWLAVADLWPRIRKAPLDPLPPCVPPNLTPVPAPPDLALQVKVPFPREGSPMTPVHPTEDFSWKDYCPMVFRCTPGRLNWRGWLDHGLEFEV